MWNHKLFYSWFWKVIWCWEEEIWVQSNFSFWLTDLIFWLSTYKILSFPFQSKTFIWWNLDELNNSSLKIILLLSRILFNFRFRSSAPGRIFHYYAFSIASICGVLWLFRGTLIMYNFMPILCLLSDYAYLFVFLIHENWAVSQACRPLH